MADRFPGISSAAMATTAMMAAMIAGCGAPWCWGAITAGDLTVVHKSLRSHPADVRRHCECDDGCCWAKHSEPPCITKIAMSQALAMPPVNFARVRSCRMRHVAQSCRKSGGHEAKQSVGHHDDDCEVGAQTAELCLFFHKMGRESWAMVAKRQRRCGEHVAETQHPNSRTPFGLPAIQARARFFGEHCFASLLRDVRS